MTAFAFDVAMAALGVNGPEDEPSTGTPSTGACTRNNVRRLRGRIFKATKDADLATVRNLQKMMLRSWSNTLVSVRQVTQRNAGRATAGMDGQVALTSRARMDLAVLVHRTASLSALAGPASVHTESQWKTQTARDSRYLRPRPPGAVP